MDGLGAIMRGSLKQGIRQLEKYNKKLGGGYKMVLEVY